MAIITSGPSGRNAVRRNCLAFPRAFTERVCRGSRRSSDSANLFTMQAVMKIVGRRRVDAAGPPGALQRTLAALRGTGALVPQGVYRFASFEEADM
jgi:hypothetical protein